MAVVDSDSGTGNVGKERRQLTPARGPASCQLNQRLTGWCICARDMPNHLGYPKLTTYFCKLLCPTVFNAL